MIKSIELTNWKTHSHTKMNFQKGVNVLVGVMGAGKSSIIDGISFGLFGTFPKLNHKRTTVEELISNRPSVKDDAEVRVTFTIGSDEYTVTRKLNRKESTASRLERNGSYLQTQTARVNEEIESLIKVDYDTFSRAIYAEQNGLDYFLELTKGDRKRQMDEMLGLDSFAKAEENATSLINQIKGLINDEEQMLAKMDRNELKSQIEKLASEKEALAKEQSSLSIKSKEGSVNVKRLEGELAELKSKYNRSKELSNSIASTVGRIDMLKKELLSINLQGIEKQKVESDYENLTKSLKEKDSELKAFKKNELLTQRALAEAESSVRLNQKKGTERDALRDVIKGRALESMKSEHDLKGNELQTLVKNLSSLQGRKDEIRKQAAELSEHVSKCPICERDIDEETRKMLLSQKEKSISEADASMEDTRKHIKRLETVLAESTKELDSVRIALSKLEDYKGIDESLAKSLQLAKEQKDAHEKLAKSVEECDTELQRITKEVNALSIKLEALKRKEKHENEIAELSKTLDSANAELKGINFDEKMLYALQELITRESSSLSEINSRITGNERYIKSVESQIEERTKSLANMNEVAERIENRRTQMANMNKFRGALVDTEARLRDSLIRSINTLMQGIWSEMYPYADYTSIRLNAKKDDYTLEASVGGEGSREWLEMDGMASGGERSTACLAMRIALAMVIVPNLRWLILDEPTHNIDENGINRFIEVLGSRLPGLVEQIFIITHDSALKNISSARVYQLERDKGRNEYTSIVEF
jgi:DNA repair protein SbcC/Rad50